MKKLITIILALALLLPAIALADLPDVTALSDQELKDLISDASAELMARNTTEPEGILIFEMEGLKVFQTADAYTSDDFLYVPIALYNENNYGVTLTPSDGNCNGWDVWCTGGNVSANAKSKEFLVFSISDADVESIDEIDSLKFRWVVYNSDFDTIHNQKEAEEHRFW